MNTTSLNQGLHLDFIISAYTYGKDDQLFYGISFYLMGTHMKNMHNRELNFL